MQRSQPGEVDIEVRRISRKKGGKVEILKKKKSQTRRRNNNHTIVTTRTSSLDFFFITGFFKIRVEITETFILSCLRFSGQLVGDTVSCGGVLYQSVCRIPFAQGSGLLPIRILLTS